VALRIAIVADAFPVLSETFVLEQVIGMLDRGHDVTVFAGRPDESSKMHRDVKRYGLIDRTRYWLGPPRSLRDVVDWGQRVAAALWKAPGVVWGTRQVARRALVTVAEDPFDAIVCHFGPTALVARALVAAGALHGKLVTVFHGYDLSVYLRQHGRRVYDELFQAGDLFLPISDHWRRQLIDMGCPVERTHVHHVGVDVEQFPFRERHRGDGPLRLVSVTRLVDKKGLRFAIDAVAMLRDRGHDVHYSIAGAGPNKHLLEQQVAALKLETSVELLGPVGREDVLALLDDAHILLAPSVTADDGDMEGIPVAIMEGMARGLPVVSTRHSGIPELVEDGVVGYLVAESDSRALADALQRLEENCHSWPAMGRAGCDKVAADFNLARMNDRLVDHLKHLIR
jgi:colanic acid/amylovoran biosynthesis glycosyltransferase